MFLKPNTEKYVHHNVQEPKVIAVDLFQSKYSVICFIFIDFLLESICKQ